MNDDLTENDIERLKEEIPAGRLGRTEEIAKTVRFILENEYITGQVIEVNGGWHV